MGRFHGAEICEPEGFYALSHVEKVKDKYEMGLYQDAGLAISRGPNSQKTDRTSNNIIEIFGSIGFLISNKFYLTNGTHHPIKKAQRQTVVFLNLIQPSSTNHQITSICNQ